MQLEVLDGQMQELTLGLSREQKELHKLQQRLSDLELLLNVEQTTLQEQTNFYQDQSRDVKNSHQLYAKTKDKFDQVRNLKESNAVQREMEATKKFIEQTEKELSRFQELMIEQEKKVGLTSQNCQNVRIQLQEQLEKIKVLESSLQQALDGLKADRLQLVNKLSDGLSKRYEMVKKRRWPVLTSLTHDTCMGCRMRIPPQLYNTILKGASLENCPSCGRFIKHQNPSL